MSTDEIKLHAEIKYYIEENHLRIKSKQVKRQNGRNFQQELHIFQRKIIAIKSAGESSPSSLGLWRISHYCSSIFKNFRLI